MNIIGDQLKTELENPRLKRKIFYITGLFSLLVSIPLFYMNPHSFTAAISRFPNSEIQRNVEMVPVCDPDGDQWTGRTSAGTGRVGSDV
jgi:hypothetical protein